MTALVSLSPDDVPEDVAPTVNGSDVPPLRCETDGCHNTLTYSGRGRRPKFCDEHKAQKPATGTKRQTGWQKGDTVEANLTKLLNWSAAGIMFINPADGKVIAKGGPAVAHELVELARIDKRFRPYLEWLAAPGKYGPLTLATAALVLPIMANHGLVPQFVIPIIEAETAEGGEKA